MNLTINRLGEMQPLLTVKEVADLLRYSPQHVARLAREGKLEHVEVAGALRFRREYIKALVTGTAQNEQEGQ